MSKARRRTGRATTTTTQAIAKDSGPNQFEESEQTPQEHETGRNSSRKIGDPTQGRRQRRLGLEVSKVCVLGRLRDVGPGTLHRVRIEERGVVLQSLFNPSPEGGSLFSPSGQDLP